jgi:Rod binding domain-containing protein
VSADAISSLGMPSAQEIVAQNSAVPGNAHTADAAKQFEAMLMENLFGVMRKTVEPSGLFGNNGNARSTYEYLLDQAVTNNAMNAGKSLGMAAKLEAAWAPKFNK